MFESVEGEAKNEKKKLDFKSIFTHFVFFFGGFFLPTMRTSTPPMTVRLFLLLWGSLPRLMQGMDIRIIPMAGRPRIDPVIIRARVVCV